MFKIDYNIVKTSFDEIETITDDDVGYTFLLGSIFFKSEGVKIDMDWDWVPVLDFAHCMLVIAEGLSNDEKANKCFEFTESDDTLEFFRNGLKLTIIPSFSTNSMEITFDEFNSEVKSFHRNISNYIREKADIRKINETLNKYLSD